MFPDAQDRPTVAFESLSIKSVSVEITLKLWNPVLHVSCGRLSVLRARVPEATVDEDRYPVLREHDIWTTEARGSLYSQVLSESRTQAVEEGPQSHFRARIPPAIAAHDR